MGFRSKRLFRRRDLRADAPSPETRWTATAPSLHTAVSPLFLAVFGVVAIGCFLLGEFLLESDYPRWAALAEHVGIAFIVALILGATYEYFLHSHRELMLRRLFDEHREKMFEALKVHLLLTPEQVFDFLSEIAIQTSETPTLYRPARREGEYTFANSIGYFNTLMEVRRKDIVAVLQRWIDTKSHRNLKFLASDFIGMYQLHELAPELRLQANRELDQLSEETRGWVLNYVWAASRCEQPRYRWLRELLFNSEDEKIQEWIVFVARQMQDQELGQMLEDFLKNRGSGTADTILVHVARALAALHRAEVFDGRGCLRRHAALFRRPAVQPEVQKSWRDLGLPPELAPVSAASAGAAGA